MDWGRTGESERGQSEVLAIGLLIGFVIVSAMGVLFVGSSALGAVQDQAAGEDDKNHVRTLSQQIQKAIDSDGEFSLEDGSEDYEVTEGANVTVTVDGTDVVQYDTGGIQRNDLRYEGGMILDDGRVIQSPELTLGDETTMVQLPALEHEGATAFDGTVRHADTETPRIPPTAQRVNITIESDYAEQWYEQFHEANADVWRDGDQVHVSFDFSRQGIRQSLHLGMADDSAIDPKEIPNLYVDSYANGTYDENDPGANAVVSTTATEFAGGGGHSRFDLRGLLRSSGDIDENLGDQSHIDLTQPPEANAELPDVRPTAELLVDPDPNWETYDGNGDPLTGGMYRASDLTIEDDLTATDHSVLVVDGDLTIEDADIEVESALDIHVHGDLYIGGQDVDIGPASEYADDATRLSVFVEDEVTMAGERHGNTLYGPEFTGLLHASEAELDVGGEFEVFGATVIDSVDADHSGNNQDEFSLHYDENLEGTSPYATERVDAKPFSPPDDFAGTYYEGDSDLGGGPYNNGVLVGGSATDDGVHGDLNVNNDPLYVVEDAAFDEAGVNSDIYTGGDLSVDGNANLNGELHVLGDLDFDSSEPITNDAFVGGDATLSGHANEDVHVLGDVDCESDFSIDGNIYVADGSTNSCHVGSAGDSPEVPDIPGWLLPSTGTIEPPTDGTVHYFDVRVAEIELA